MGLKPDSSDALLLAAILHSRAGLLVACGFGHEVPAYVFLIGGWER